ncbi:hypothetical protein CEXT_529001 [Caerostris extrusa]|uniref:Uncharacterized protein n=1 Tax=Caerostris extrusa TaxID=172846 RepID=A0AAV4R4M9_CAEEX|nr:hypothetical protein CEXT_529001 [Caerostris extrusa]
MEVKRKIKLGLEKENTQLNLDETDPKGPIVSWYGKIVMGRCQILSIKEDCGEPKPRLASAAPLKEARTFSREYGCDRESSLLFYWSRLVCLETYEVLPLEVSVRASLLKHNWAYPLLHLEDNRTLDLFQICKDFRLRSDSFFPACEPVTFKSTFTYVCDSLCTLYIGSASFAI